MISASIEIEQMERAIKDCKKLISHYEKKVTILRCPFCVRGCSGCPWMWFTGNGCVHEHGFDIVDLRIKRDSKWTKKRIPELKDWIKKINAEIRCRKSRVKK